MEQYLPTIVTGVNCLESPPPPKDAHYFFYSVFLDALHWTVNKYLSLGTTVTEQWNAGRAAAPLLRYMSTDNIHHAISYPHGVII